jgi:hypothetical protein
MSTIIVIIILLILFGGFGGGYMAILGGEPGGNGNSRTCYFDCPSVVAIWWRRFPLILGKGEYIKRSPRSRAASRPSRVRSRIMFLSNSAKAPRIWSIIRPAGTVAHWQQNQ